MPHIIIEHSANIASKQIQRLFGDIQNIMAAITEGNFDLEQCKARAFSFNEYLVGSIDEKNAEFLHITIKIMAGRSDEIRKKLAENVMAHVKKIYEEYALAPNAVGQVAAIIEGAADLITGTPNVQMPVEGLAQKRCDISVDIVEMCRNSYQKFRFNS